MLKDDKSKIREAHRASLIACMEERSGREHDRQSQHRREAAPPSLAHHDLETHCEMEREAET
jgi:hypothetical protein